MAALMYSRRISALLALPIMAVLIAAIGGIPADQILKDVINDGALKLHAAYAATMVGAVLAELINKHGIAKAMVRWVAEFAGDSPFLLGMLMTLVTALLFSSLGGLGAVIMVGTVVLPVMLSLGIPAAVAGGLYLFGINLGGMFNLSNWVLYRDVLNIEQAQIVNFVLPFSAILSMVLIAFLTIELRRLANLKYALAFFAATALGLAGIATSSRLSAADTAAAGGPLSASFTIVVACLGILSCYAIYRHVRRVGGLPGLAFLTPAVPLVLVLFCKWDIISAFLAGISYGVLVTWRRDSVNLLTRSIIEGAQSVIPAVILMMGIGMLLCAVMHKTIASAVAPLLASAVPTQALPFVITFTLLAPLALYRGPLSLWGMGSGLVALMQKSTALSGQAIMGMLMSVGQLQGVCDPTNTHNVWIATYLGTDAQVLLRKTIPYVWFAVIAGLTLAVCLGYVKL
jgi:C4-dicarboxylate transporter, DcuC family